MNKIIAGLFTFFAANSNLYALDMIKVELMGGFYAQSERTITQGGDKSAFVYSVLGGTRLTASNGSSWRLSIECLGFDELGGQHGTAGTGRCIWSDGNGDQLFVTVSTVGEGNRYDVTGGTGKWLGATGQIDTVFTYLPAPSEIVFLGVDEGKGSISTPLASKH